MLGIRRRGEWTLRRLRRRRLRLDDHAPDRVETDRWPADDPRGRSTAAVWLYGRSARPPPRSGFVDDPRGRGAAAVWLRGRSAAATRLDKLRCCACGGGLRTFEPLNDVTIRIATTCYFDESCPSEARYGPIGNWDTSLVTNMKMLFCADDNPCFDYHNPGAAFFNEDISSWIVSNVTDMSYMFLSAATFNISLATWNVARVTDMSYMFYCGGYSCYNPGSAFSQPLDSWDVSGPCPEVASSLDTCNPRWQKSRR